MTPCRGGIGIGEVACGAAEICGVPRLVCGLRIVIERVVLMTAEVAESRDRRDGIVVEVVVRQDAAIRSGTVWKQVRILVPRAAAIIPGVTVGVKPQFAAAIDERRSSRGGLQPPGGAVIGGKQHL